MVDTWFLITEVNPEPWEAPSVAVGKSGGKFVPRHFRPAKYEAYLESVREAFRIAYPDFECLDEPLEVAFYFWRNVPVNEFEGRKTTGNYADTTNLQKAAEDALQGLVYKNDRSNVCVSGRIIEQGMDVESATLVHVQSDTGPSDTVMIKRWALVEPQLPVTDNVLPKERGADGLF